MNQELKTKWIEALRSGKYKQGQGCLRNGKDEFCCLGVLCDVVDPNGWELSIEDGIYVFGKNRDFGNLSVFIRYKESIEKADENILIGMNDEDEEDFGSIANYIEKNL